MEQKIKIAVVGAHLTGQPLNYQLTDEGGNFVKSCKNSPIYRLYTLIGGNIPQPGLIRQGNGEGYSINVEVWELPTAGFGRFVTMIASFLDIGTLVFKNSEEVKGFLCDFFAIENAVDISKLGGW